jgi:hypothetical protein
MVCLLTIKIAFYNTSVVILLHIIIFLTLSSGNITKKFFKKDVTEIDFTKKYYQNTFISDTRAMSDYLLKPRLNIFSFLLLGGLPAVPTKV